MTTQISLANTIAFPSHKGGVGKTTTVMYLARAFAEPRSVTKKGLRVLAIDMDAQANLSKLMGVVVEDHMHIGSALGGAVAPTITLAQILRPVGQNIQLAPSRIDLANVEVGLQQAAFNPTFGFGRALTALRRAIDPIRSDFDVILIDCPPAAGILTVNAMLASGKLVLPSLPEETSIDGLKTILQVLKQMQDDLKYSPQILGTVATMVQQKTVSHQQGLAKLATLTADGQTTDNGKANSESLEMLGEIYFRKGKDAETRIYEYYQKLAEKIWKRMQ